MRCDSDVSHGLDRGCAPPTGDASRWTPRNGRRPVLGRAIQVRVAGEAERDVAELAVLGLTDHGAQGQGRLVVVVLLRGERGDGDVRREREGRLPAVPG